VVSGELAGWDQGGPGAHLKVFLPQPEGDPVMRTYTVRHFDANAGALTLEFVIHGHGPASSWASAAAPGERFAVAGQARSGFQPSEGARWCLLAGDQSALPAIAAVAEALAPGFVAHAIVEVPDRADEVGLDSPAELRTTWLVASRSPGEELVAAVTALELPDGPGDVWVGCEATAMRRIRAHLLQEQRLPPRALHTRAYWKVDVANHSDHDTGAEDDAVLTPGAANPAGAGDAT
jgi:NADPH-dependent ferric siderophore reductase